MFVVFKVTATTENGLRKASFLTCGAVCSQQIDIDLEGDVVRRVQ